MSSLAAKTSPEGDMSRRSLTVIANLDLIVLAIALPVFIFAGFPIAGYLVAAALWLTSRSVHAYATLGEIIQVMKEVFGTYEEPNWI